MIHECWHSWPGTVTVLDGQSVIEPCVTLAVNGGECAEQLPLFPRTLDCVSTLPINAPREAGCCCATPMPKLVSKPSLLCSADFPLLGRLGPALTVRVVAPASRVCAVTVSCLPAPLEFALLRWLLTSSAVFRNLPRFTPLAPTAG